MSSGLQKQRTELAWLRTTLSSWVVAVLTARVAFPVGVLVLTGPVAITAIAHARRRRLKGAGSPSVLPNAVGVCLAVACVVINLAGFLALWNRLR